MVGGQVMALLIVMGVIGLFAVEGKGEQPAGAALTTGPATTQPDLNHALGWRRDAAGALWVRARFMHDPEVKERKTRLLADIQAEGFKAGEVELDQYGGWKGENFGTTGFFHAKKIGERWWLIDPEGFRYLDIGMNGVAIGRGPQVKKAFAEKFGTPEKWRDETLQMLWDLGFKGTGAWSDDKLNRGAERKLSYAPAIYFVADYARKKGLATPDAGHVGFKNKCIPVFDPEFEAFCDATAKPFAQRKDDPWLLGYFSDNELSMPDDSLDRFFSLGMEDASGQAARKFLDEHGVKDPGVKDKEGKYSGISDAQRQEWQALVADRYFRIVSKAIRKYDPNHMYLGSRLWGEEKWNPAVWAAAGKYLDAIAVNVYAIWDPGWVVETKWSKWAGKPIIVTEWYAKGMDSGMPNNTGAGWTVATQKERGWFYEQFTLSLLEARGCVGWHWFIYQDNDVQDKNAEKSNLDSNKGIVSVKYVPYEDLVDSMKRVNVVAYQLENWFEARHPVWPEEKK